MFAEKLIRQNNSISQSQMEAFIWTEVKLCQIAGDVWENPAAAAEHLFTCRGPGFDVPSTMHHRVLSLSFFGWSQAIPDNQTWKDRTQLQVRVKHGYRLNNRITATLLHPGFVHINHMYLTEESFCVVVFFIFYFSFKLTSTEVQWNRISVGCWMKIEYNFWLKHFVPNFFFYG